MAKGPSSQPWSSWGVAVREPSGGLFMRHTTSWELQELATLMPKDKPGAATKGSRSGKHKQAKHWVGAGDVLLKCLLNILNMFSIHLIN